MESTDTNRFDHYISDSAQNHFKLLVVPEEGINKDEIIAILKRKGWQYYSITQELLVILDKIPKEKRRLRVQLSLKNGFIVLLEKNLFLITLNCFFHLRLVESIR